MPNLLVLLTIFCDVITLLIDSKTNFNEVSIGMFLKLEHVPLNDFRWKPSLLSLLICRGMAVTLIDQTIIFTSMSWHYSSKRFYSPQLIAMNVCSNIWSMYSIAMFVIFECTKNELSWFQFDLNPGIPTFWNKSNKYWNYHLFDWCSVASRILCWSKHALKQLVTHPLTYVVNKV